MSNVNDLATPLIQEPGFTVTSPETRPSILLRLQDPSDGEAWWEFETVYRNVIRSLARSCGFQDADASDVEQEVMLRISRSIRQFEYDPQKARFRTWLGQIIRSAMIDFHRKRPRDRASGLTETARQLTEIVDESEDAFERRYQERCQREILQWACKRIRNEFNESTWNAFWKTAIETKEVAVVAAELGKSVGAIYTSRSRVIRRLREVSDEFDERAIELNSVTQLLGESGDTDES